MSEYSKLPVEKLATIFDDDDAALMKKILNEVDSKVGSLHEHLEKELELSLIHISEPTRPY